MSLPEFMVRVKLPSASAFHSSPSGDTEYEDAYDAALNAVVPPGFEVIRERLGIANPKDSEGYTYVRLRCVDKDNVVATLARRVAELESVLDSVRTAIKTFWDAGNDR